MPKFGRLRHLVFQIKLKFSIGELKNNNKYSLVDKFLKETNIPIEVKKRKRIKNKE